MNDDSHAKAIRGLATAVWALTVVMAVATVAPYLWGFVLKPRGTAPAAEADRESSEVPPRPVSGQRADDLEGFYDWPVEKKIAAASAILLTTNSDDGDKVTSTVAEILLVRPGTTLYYKVGDEFTHGSRYKTEGVSYGEGDVVFMTGSPATMRYSSSYSGGRCGGLADIPIEKLKELIAAQGPGGSQQPDLVSEP